jgi:hypothetical protein
MRGKCGSALSNNMNRCRKIRIGVVIDSNFWKF